MEDPFLIVGIIWKFEGHTAFVGETCKEVNDGFIIIERVYFGGWCRQ